MPLQEMAKVISNTPVKPSYYLMELKSPRVAEEARPGQFVHIKLGNSMDPLLRRPISLYGINAAEGTITLLYVVVGRGTKLLSEVPAGAELDIMGALGRGFWLPKNASRVLVIGGGIGVAPLLPVVKWLNAEKAEFRVLYGFRNSEAVVGVEEINNSGWSLQIATDDGSVGHRGFVTDLVKQALEEFKPDYYYVCGPEIMIKNVVKMLSAAGIAGQVSLEARMGCGVGACLACTCKTKAGSANATPQEFDYSLVCTQGPVFDAGEVMFNE